MPHLSMPTEPYQPPQTNSSRRWAWLEVTIVVVVVGALALLTLLAIRDFKRNTDRWDMQWNVQQQSQE